MEDALRLAAAIEYRSEHHFASAIVQEAEARSISYEGVSVTSFEAIPGMGVQAMIGGERYYLGNHLFCEERGFCSPVVEAKLDSLSSEGKTGVVFGKEKKPIAIIALKDTAREGTRSTVAKLEGYGIKHMMLLSGDHDAATNVVAAEVGLIEYAGNLLPEQKVEAIEKLKSKHGIVAMVGDGINDAPALAASSVGIAMGVSGTDAALETADVVLMGDDIKKLPLLLGLCSRAMTVVRQNITLAVIVKAVFLVLSISGVATLWMAVLADDGAALAVILNGLRLLAYREDR
jgi:Cd2+/Zn2+-exporting ATPase